MYERFVIPAGDIFPLKTSFNTLSSLGDLSSLRKRQAQPYDLTNTIAGPEVLIPYRSNYAHMDMQISMSGPVIQKTYGEKIGAVGHAVEMDFSQAQRMTHLTEHYYRQLKAIGINVPNTAFHTIELKDGLYGVQLRQEYIQGYPVADLWTDAVKTGHTNAMTGIVDTMAGVVHVVAHFNPEHDSDLFSYKPCELGHRFRTPVAIDHKPQNWVVTLIDEKPYMFLVDLVYPGVLDKDGTIAFLNSLPHSYRDKDPAWRTLEQRWGTTTRMYEKIILELASLVGRHVPTMFHEVIAFVEDRVLKFIQTHESQEMQEYVLREATRNYIEYRTMCGRGEGIRLAPAFAANTIV